MVENYKNFICSVSYTSLTSMEWFNHNITFFVLCTFVNGNDEHNMKTFVHNDKICTWTIHVTGLCIVAESFV